MWRWIPEIPNTVYLAAAAVAAILLLRTFKAATVEGFESVDAQGNVVLDKGRCGGIMDQIKITRELIIQYKAAGKVSSLNVATGTLDALVNVANSLGCKETDTAPKLDPAEVNAGDTLTDAQKADAVKISKEAAKQI